MRYIMGLIVTMLLSVGVLAGCLGGCKEKAPVPVSTALDQIRADVSLLRGLSSTKEVDCQFITKGELRERLLDMGEEEYPQEEAQIEQEVLVLLDLIEEGQDLHDILLNLYSEEIIGFYDRELEELYVVSDMAGLGPMEEVTFAHEYTHALQDQHFDLDSLPSPEDNSDICMAVDSLMEGDATLVEGMYFWQILDDSEREALFQEFEESEDGAFEAAPRVIQENLVFPYEAGIEFVIALYERGGWDAVNRAYSDPPQSTEQILHPEKYYLERDEPQAVTMRDLEGTLGHGWSQLETDVLGELNMRIYLETFVDTSQATRAAEGWDGDRYVYLKDAEGRKLLVLHSFWDSVTDAQEFFDAYITFVQQKSGGTWALHLDQAGAKWWDTEGLSLYLGQEQSQALVVIGPDEAITRAALTGFPEFQVTPTPVTPAAGLVSWWPLDGDANDVVGTNHGTLYGGATFATGLADQAVSLDGVDDFVMVPDSPSLSFGANDFTVALWVNFNTTVGEQVLIEKYVETYGTPREEVGH